MRTTQGMNVTFGENFKKMLIDFTSIFFLFHIVRFLISYFYFILFLPGFLVLWLAYNIISLGVCQQTLGSSFFGIRLVNQGSKSTFWFRLILRELFTSLPGILLIVFCFIRYISSSLNGFSIGFIKWEVGIIVVILLFISFFRARIYKLKMTKGGTMQRTSSIRYTRKRVVIMYSILLLLAGASRYFHTCFTNDIPKVRSSFNELPFKHNPYDEIFNFVDWAYFLTPRPTAQSVQEYTNFLETNRKDINDYVFSLFEKYDHVILCERLHPEMTQYDMIYNLVTDSRFTEKIGVVFTEMGNVESRDTYKKLTNTTFPNDTVFQQALSSFMMENQSFHLLWSSTNWFEFLSKMYSFNHNKEKKVDVLFTDRPNWKYNDKSYDRDRLMADNIISTIKKDTLKKSLTIMNYRHAYLRDSRNCGYHVSKEFPGKVANILINTNGLKQWPLQSGKWDVAFEQMPEEAYAFDLKNSPFGKDDFDHFLFLSDLAKLHYEDMFTGVIYYKPLYMHYFGDGYPYMTQPGNMEILRKRAAKLGEKFHENSYQLYNNYYYRCAKMPYFIINLLDNFFFVWSLIGGLGILIYLSVVCAKTKES